MKQSAALLTLLTLATIFTVGCGDNRSVPQFTNVAFVSSRTVSPATPLFTSKLDGTAVTPVPGVASNPYFPSISADGKTVAYYQAGDIWVQKTDGTGLLKLTTTANENFSRISPNGKKVLYEDNSVGHLHILNADGTGDTDLTPTLPSGMGVCYSAAFSSDSAQIVFVCSGQAIYGIYTAKADGTGMKTVTATRATWTDTPSFTPDNKKILVASRNSANVWNVASLNLDGTGETLMATGAYESEVLNSTLYYTNFNSTTSLYQVYKSNLDGTNAVLVSDGTSTDYLGLSD